MSSIAQVNNGTIVNNNANSTSAISKAQKAAKQEAGGSLDKDAFLQLLVAQMKYQDPLEPTDNTEYVSQLATFSELEEMQNMVSSSDMQRASALVGQYVSVAQTSATGNTTYVDGYVDSVVYQGNKTYLSINDVLYDFDDLEQVYDNDYILAMKLAEAAKNAEEKNAGETNAGSDKKESKVEE